MKNILKLNTVKGSASPREAAMWLLILLVLVFLGAKRIFAPMNEELHNTRAQLEAKKMELDAYKKILKSRVAAAKKLPTAMDLGRQMIAQRVKQAFEKANIIPDVVVSELMTDLTLSEFAKSALLEKFNFVGEKKQMGYTEINLDLRLMGSYNGIAEYLNKIRELPYLLRVEAFDLKPHEEDGSKKVQLLAKSVLYVGNPKEKNSGTFSAPRSDTAMDLLLESTRAKLGKAPFEVKNREIEAWSLHELKLTSTMAGSSHPSALINGRMFEIGNEIADFKIIEIKPREVVLQRGDVHYILKIYEDNYDNSAESEPETPAKEEVKKENISTQKVEKKEEPPPPPIENKEEGEPKPPTTD